MAGTADSPSPKFGVTDAHRWTVFAERECGERSRSSSVPSLPRLDEEPSATDDADEDRMPIATAEKYADAPKASDSHASSPIASLSARADSLGVSFAGCASPGALSHTSASSAAVGRQARVLAEGLERRAAEIASLVEGLEARIPNMVAAQVRELAAGLAQRAEEARDALSDGLERRARATEGAVAGLEAAIPRLVEMHARPLVLKLEGLESRLDQHRLQLQQLQQEQVMPDREIGSPAWRSEMDRLARLEGLEQRLAAGLPIGPADESWRADVERLSQELVEERDQRETLRAELKADLGDLELQQERERKVLAESAARVEDTVKALAESAAHDRALVEELCGGLGTIRLQHSELVSSIAALAAVPEQAPVSREEMDEIRLLCGKALVSREEMDEIRLLCGKALVSREEMDEIRLLCGNALVSRKEMDEIRSECEAIRKQCLEELNPKFQQQLVLLQDMQGQLQTLQQSGGSPVAAEQPDPELCDDSPLVAAGDTECLLGRRLQKLQQQALMQADLLVDVCTPRTGIATGAGCHIEYRQEPFLEPGLPSDKVDKDPDSWSFVDKKAFYENQAQPKERRGDTGHGDLPEAPAPVSEAAAPVPAGPASFELRHILSDMEQHVQQLHSGESRADATIRRNLEQRRVADDSRRQQWVTHSMEYMDLRSEQQLLLKEMQREVRRAQSATADSDVVAKRKAESCEVVD
eukprot:gnl/TRDRNA2_/TRDRNA2_42408_c0_seq1.p1 gnl/TRDRNA2_/TRDRNA2_42408_c0~~gnl/TRDRNA2_/TRDRNA2_42408_c0_seq1.p1  ORF type:complete len:745 (+),score=179.13 gnl/TRDRNA2_/TRDRNA2_42408_c0_seq1:132-2237(+)